jgi:hypothetical protein
LGACGLWKRDGHAVWLWSSGQAGWKDEAAQYDNAIQPYGAIFQLRAAGRAKRQRINSLREAPRLCLVTPAERSAVR